jgi:signal recognition particle subunit SRP19
LKLNGKMVVWPVNIDSSKSHKQGRKVGKSTSVQAPRLEEIAEAARQLGFEPEVVPGKSRPTLWWEHSGYAVFPKSGVRADLLRSLAGEVRKARAKKVVPEKKP